MFLNNDTEVINPDWLEKMLMHVLRSEIGCVGAKLYYANQKIQHAGIIIGISGIAGHSHKKFDRKSQGYLGQLVNVRNNLANTGACLMVKKEIFKQVKGFDDRFAFAFGDVDLCLKIYSNGYLNIWTPSAELYHYESKTRGYETTMEQQKRYKNEEMIFTQK